MPTLRLGPEGLRTKGRQLERYRESFEILNWVAVGVTVQAPDGQIVYANDAAARVMGFGDSAEIQATPLPEVMDRFEILADDDSPLPVDQLPSQIALKGKEAPEMILRFRRRGTHEDRWSIVQARPVFDDVGGVRLVINVFRDITAIKRAEMDRIDLLHAEREARQMAEHAVDRVMRLQAITGALAEAITTDDVVHATITAGLAALEADAGSIAIADNEENVLRIVHSSGYPEEVVERFRVLPLDSDMPLVAAFRDQAVMTIASQAERAERYPSLASVQTRYVSLAAVPMVVEGRAIGAFGLSFAEPKEFSEEDRAFMLAVAQQCGLALERARLYELERDAREESEAARERMAFLARASSELSQSLDYKKTLSNVARLMVPRMADWVGVDIVDDDGEVQQVAVAHIDPAKVEFAHEMRKRYPPDLESSTGIGEILRTGESLFMPEIHQDLIEASAQDEEHLELIRNLQIRSAMAVPLQARGRTFGALSFVAAESGRVYTEEDLVMAEEVGRRAGFAIDNAKLFESTQSTERRLSQLVQNLDAILWEAEPSMRCFTFVSKRAADILGYPVERWMDELDFWTSMVHPEDREPVMEYRRMSTQAGEDHTVEYRMVTPQGREIWLRDIAHVVRDSDGHVNGLRGLMVDITEQKMVERLLSESRERFAHVARTLQSSLLPPELPAIPGFELAARYRAAGQGNEVGGDFYDAFQTEEGKWALALGDVMGKGPKAAALTGLARHTLRALATDGRGPSEVLRRLNDAILKQDETTTQFATVILAFVSREGSSGKVIVSSGGHHLPLLLSADGTVDKVGAPGMVLGVFPEPDLEDVEVTLNPGDSIVFYTDGVIEEGEGTNTFGEANLAAVVAGAAGKSPSEIAEAIETAVVDWTPDDPRDDIAILALTMSSEGEVEITTTIAVDNTSQ